MRGPFGRRGPDALVTDYLLGVLDEQERLAVENRIALRPDFAPAGEPLLAAVALRRAELRATASPEEVAEVLEAVRAREAAGVEPGPVVRLPLPSRLPETNPRNVVLTIGVAVLFLLSLGYGQLWKGQHRTHRYEAPADVWMTFAPTAGARLTIDPRSRVEWAMPTCECDVTLPVQLTGSATLELDGRSQPLRVEVGGIRIRVAGEARVRIETQPDGEIGVRAFRGRADVQAGSPPSLVVDQGHSVLASPGGVRRGSW